MFGFDRCKLVFTETNWNVPQKVYVAPIPGANPMPRDTMIPVSLVPTTDSAGVPYEPGLLQVFCCPLPRVEVVF